MILVREKEYTCRGVTKRGTALASVYKIDKDVLFNLRYDGCHFGPLEQFQIQPPKIGQKLLSNNVKLFLFPFT